MKRTTHNSLLTTLFITLVLAGLSLNLSAQMWNGQDTLYGNEWINYDQSYFKIEVAKDGIYRLSGEQLMAQGIPVSSIPANRFQLFHLGKEVPLYISTPTTMGPNDYLEFYGQKNRAELDSFLFADPEADLLNPYYSLFTDTAAYFLTWLTADAPTLRYTDTENDLSGELPAAEEWFMWESRAVFAEHFLKRYQRFGEASIFFSHFDTGEGFGSRSILNFLQGGDQNTMQSVTLNLPYLVPDGPMSQFKARFACGLSNHQQRIQLELQEPLTETINFNGFQVVEVEIPVNSIQIPENEQIQVRFQGLGGNKDAQSLAFVSIQYPRAFNFSDASSFEFSIEAFNERKYLEIEGFNIGSNPPILYDLTNQLRIETVFEAGKLKVTLPPSARERSLVLVNPESGLEMVEEIQSVEFYDYNDLNRSFVIISHSDFYDDGSGQNWVQAYADYRSSVQGGAYQTLVVDIQELYDQFAYGIGRHSMSIRNFAHFTKKNWSAIQFFLIIGKGRRYSDIRKSNELAQSAGVNFFVPSFGYPSSDNLLMSDATLKAPIIPIGRIAATTPNEIRIYLNKLKAFDQSANNAQTIEDRAWMKNIMHLGGGARPSEQISIENNLKSMENIISNNIYGGNVTGFYKTSTDPIQNSDASQLFDRINEGVSVITFFGHSSPGSFDFNIDNPDNYNNSGKHPLMLSLGCYSGDIFMAGQSASERFIFYEDKAAIAFGASIGVGFISTLSAFNQQYYRFLGDELYGASIGEVQKATINFFADNTNDLFMQPLKEQFTLHGDPAIRLYPRPGPDYVVDRSSINFKPKVINAQLDSFDLSFAVVNLGRHEADSMRLAIAQKLPGGETVQLLETRIATPPYSHTLQFRLPNNGRAAVGQNTLFIELDVENEILELPAPEAELNNKLVRASGEEGILFFVLDNTARPVLPKQFSIVSDVNVVLKASTSDAFAPERKYILEIDTTQLFDSPLKRREEIVQSGGVIKWQPGLNWLDNTAYYWRISPDTSNTNIGFTWEESTFTFLENSSPGWNQGHYFQFLDDAFFTVQMDNEDRELVFFGDQVNVRIENKIFNSSTVRPALYYDFEGQALSVIPWNYLDAGVAVVVSTPQTASFWKNPPPGADFEEGDYGVPTGNSRVFAFPTSTLEERANLIEFLEQVVPDGYFVFLFTVLKTSSADFQPETWGTDSLSIGTNLFQVLENEGALSIRELASLGSVPYVLMYQKGDGIMNEGIAGSMEGSVNIDAFIPIRLTEGYFSSVEIGPARQWGALSWAFDENTLMPSDSLYLSVIGINQANQDSLLVEKLFAGDTSLQFINAAEFPHLKLRFHAIDQVDRSPTQLKHWRVLYDGLPELAINPSRFLELQNDSLQQGEPFLIRMALENLSKYDMDSVLVKYTLSDPANNESVKYQRFGVLPKEDTLIIGAYYDTKLFSGRQNLIIEANPDGDQLEEAHFNNFANLQFGVERDRINPILDVTFDGLHIMNGDIVSPNPQILVSLKDENPFLSLSDSSLFELRLRYPDGNLINIPLDGEIAQFYPAESNQNNRATVELNPTLIQDGIYHLNVRAKDISGNNSGLFDYEVEFEVINKNMISNILNYPNPFSTSTQFVYTLTGEEPTYFKIQILTVSGRVVREIGMEELGSLKVGTHRTEYAWDGTDEFGDRLANGVYLYQVVAKDFNGKDYETYTNGTESSFKYGFGKMVILR